MKNKMMSLFLSMLVSISFITSAKANVAMPTPSRGVTVSYLQTAGVTTLKPLNQEKGIYVLTLRAVNPYTTYFSDRPARVVGKMSNKAFITNWSEGDNNFNEMSPNAMLNGLALQGKRLQSVSIPVVLSAPNYNVKKGTMTYQVTIMNKTNIPTTMTLHYGVLFIDGGACITCIG